MPTPPFARAPSFRGPAAPRRTAGASRSARPRPPAARCDRFASAPPPSTCDAVGAARCRRRASRCSPSAARRYLDLAGRIRRLLGDAGRPTTRCSGGRPTRSSATTSSRGLGHGLAVAVYVGHGRPSGWVGYAGVRPTTSTGTADRPERVVVSLACQTVEPPPHRAVVRRGAVAQGTAAAAIGAVGETDHIANARWALRLVDALAAGRRTAGELLVAAEPEARPCARLPAGRRPARPAARRAGRAGRRRALTDDVDLDPQQRGDPRMTDDRDRLSSTCCARSCRQGQGHAARRRRQPTPSDDRPRARLARRRRVRRPASRSSTASSVPDEDWQQLEHARPRSPTTSRPPTGDRRA